MMSRPLSPDLIAYIEKPYPTHWWGQRYDVEPKVLSETFGDGQLLLTVQPLNTRPHYYVVAVDSSWWDEEANDLDHDLIHDEIEGVVQALEEHFGVAWDEDDPDACESHADGCEWCKRQGWPLVDLFSGYGWGSLGDVDEIGQCLGAAPRAQAAP